MSRIIAVTGHRPNKLGGYSLNTLNRLYRLAYRWLAQERPDELIEGAALGWDTACGLASYKLEIPYTAAVPFRSQDCKWNIDDVSRYRRLLAYASKVVYVDELPEYAIATIRPGEYHPAKMQKRNEYMLDNCTEVLALWDTNPKGGTYNAIKYAQSKGLKITNLWQEFTKL